MMPQNMILAILNDVSRWQESLTEIIPVNYGELMLRNDWYWILDQIQQKLPNTQIVLPTNGYMMTEENVNKLCTISTLKLINFSINAFFEETYKAFTGFNPDNLCKIESAIKRIKVIRPDITIWASMVFDPMYQTDKERDMFKDYWKDKVNAVQIMGASSALRPDKTAQIKNVIPCRSIFSDMVIGYDGKLSSCCFDPSFTLDLGYYTNDAKKDWLNEGMTKLREIHNSHRRLEIPICRRCTSG
jgi:hypothetical protein